ncbi:MAG: hypothetical protein NTW10_12065 [Bacteroidetes bacterium]|nr:hypothetical protein [Bacteroidota bacterium]
MNFILSEKAEKPYLVTLRFYNLVFFSALIPYFNFLPFIPSEILGFKWSGWAWLFMLFVSIGYLFKLKKNGFPVIIWLPFIIYTLIWAIVDKTFVGFRFFIQPVIPIIVGLIASSLTYNTATLNILYKMFKRFFWFLIILVFIFPLIRYGQFSTYLVPGSAALVMTLTMFTIIFLSIYFSFFNLKFLLLYIGMLLTAFILVTRTAILINIIILPFHFLNNKLISRIFTAFSGVVVALLIFYSEPIQNKMFYEGGGSFSDISYDNPNFNTSGRKTNRTIIEVGLAENPLWGNGPRADLDLYTYFNLKPTILHDDYSLIRYCFGWFGLALYIGAFAVQFIILYRKKKAYRTKYSRIIWGTALTLYIPYFIFMNTDNIFLYGPWYGYFFFAFIGMVHSLSSNPNKEREILPGRTTVLKQISE